MSMCCFFLTQPRRSVMLTLSSGARSRGLAFRCPISVTLKMTVEITVTRVTVVRGCSWEGPHAAHRTVLVDGVGGSLSDGQFGT